MPKQKSRVPKEEGKFKLWYDNLNNNLPSVAAAVGVTAAQLARVANDSVAWGYLMLRNEVIKSYKGEESKLKQKAYTDGDPNDPPLMLPTLSLPEKPDVVINQGIWEWANKLVQRIVKADDFTPEIEVLLDIEIKGEEERPIEELRGEIKSYTVGNGGVVVLKSTLQGYKSYRVFSQRGSTDTFEAIGDSTQADFTDERPNLVAGQPETRQYKTICLENNKPIGDYSPIETVTTKP